MTDMLKKSEKINTSDGYVKSDNLTEQWKKGELPFGAYYVNRLEEHRIWLYSDRSQTYDNSYEIYEVLAKVPSYEQWRAKLEENTQLKELLKRAKMVLEDEGDYMIAQEINQVLGEE